MTKEEIYKYFKSEEGRKLTLSQKRSFWLAEKTKRRLEGEKEKEKQNRPPFLTRIKTKINQIYSKIVYGNRFVGVFFKERGEKNAESKITTEISYGSATVKDVIDKNSNWNKERERVDNHFKNLSKSPADNKKT